MSDNRTAEQLCDLAGWLHPARCTCSYRRTEDGPSFPVPLTLKPMGTPTVPGDYQSKCADCGRQMIFADKRCILCTDCAKASSRQGECPSGTTSEPNLKGHTGKIGESPAPLTSKEDFTLANTIADRAVRNVCELPDYTSPDDRPELLQCEAAELHAAIIKAIEAVAPQLIHAHETPPQFSNQDDDPAAHIHLARLRSPNYNGDVMALRGWAAAEIERLQRELLSEKMRRNDEMRLRQAAERRTAGTAATSSDERANLVGRLDIFIDCADAQPEHEVHSMPILKLMREVRAHLASVETNGRLHVAESLLSDVYRDIIDRSAIGNFLSGVPEKTPAVLTECPYCKRPADNQGCIVHVGGCAGLERVDLNRLQYDALVARGSAEKTDSKLPGVVAGSELEEQIHMAQSVPGNCEHGIPRRFCTAAHDKPLEDVIAEVERDVNAQNGNGERNG